MFKIGRISGLQRTRGIFYNTLALKVYNRTVLETRKLPLIFCQIVKFGRPDLNQGNDFATRKNQVALSPVFEISQH